MDKYLGEARTKVAPAPVKTGLAFWGGMDSLDVVKCASLAEKSGFESLWCVEGHGGDAFSTLAACALSTKRVKLGTSIVSVFVRSPPTIALGAATVDALSGGRFILGLGSSHRVQVEPEHGLVYQKPMQRIRETVQIIRELFEKGEVSFTGEVFPKVHYDFWFTPLRKSIPIYFSALFPKMLELSGQLADGAILSWNTLERARQSAGIVREAAVKAGRKRSQVRIASIVLTSVSPDYDAAIRGIREKIAFYAGFFPRYNKLFAESGFGEDTALIRETYEKSGLDEATKVVSERMAKALAIVGTSEDCIKQLEHFKGSGVDLPILFPSPPASKKKTPDVKAAYRETIGIFR